eukprot:UN06922
MEINMVLVVEVDMVDIKEDGINQRSQNIRKIKIVQEKDMAYINQKAVINMVVDGIKVMVNMTKVMINMIVMMIMVDIVHVLIEIMKNGINMTQKKVKVVVEEDMVKNKEIHMNQEVVVVDGIKAEIMNINLVMDEEVVMVEIIIIIETVEGKDMIVMDGRSESGYGRHIS